MAESHGITVKDMLAWNEKLLRDCINLDDDTEKPICVSISPGGTKPPRGLKAHNAKKMAKRPKPKIQVAPKHVTPVAAHGPAKDRRIEGNPEIQRSRSIARTLPQISRSRHTNAAATMGYAAFSAVGVELASLVLVF